MSGHHRGGWSSAILALAAAAASVAAATGAALTSPARAAQVRVAIVAKGDVGHYAGMCDNAGGTDSLGGTLELKHLGDDGTAFYEGRLARVTEVTACGTKPAPTEDQVVMCTANLSGRAPMEVSLEVYEDDRGAYVKSEPATPLPSETVMKQISGCTEPGEFLDAYPADGWMSGLDFEHVPSGPLGAGTHTTGNTTLTVF